MSEVTVRRDKEEKGMKRKKKKRKRIFMLSINEGFFLYILVFLCLVDSTFSDSKVLNATELAFTKSHLTYPHLF